MRKFSKIKWNHYINYIAIAAFTAVFGIMSVTAGLPFSAINIIEKVGIAIILAVSLSMIVGFLGELSLGHAGFMCVGAFIGGKVAVMLSNIIGDGFLNLIVSIIAGSAAAAICGIIIGLPALRLKGDYLAIVTLAFGEIVRTLFLNSGGVFGDQSGFSTPRYDKKYFFIIIFVIALICLAVIQNLIRSKHGRAITSIRDSEIAAKATGINITKYKLTVFAVAALFAGAAGVLFSFSNYKIQSINFSYNRSIEILVMVVLGGMGNINGSIIAAALITFLDVKLQTILTGNLAVLQDLLYALILICIIIYNNASSLKSFRETYNLRNLINKIKKQSNDPAHIHDDEAKWDRVPTKIDMDEILSVDIQKSSPYKPDVSKEEK